MLSLAESRALAKRYAAQHTKHAHLIGTRLTYFQFRPERMAVVVVPALAAMALVINRALDARSAGERSGPYLAILAMAVVIALGLIMLASEDYLDLDTGNICRRYWWRPTDKLLINVQQIDQVRQVFNRGAVALDASGTMNGRRVKARIGVFRTRAAAQSFVQLITAMGAGTGPSDRTP